MNWRTILTATVAGFLLSLSALAQNQPLPRPVSPPLPIPGSNPPSGTNANPTLPPPAADRPAPATAADPVLAPYIDGQTIGVLRFDVKDLDLKSISDWVIQGVDELRKSNKEIARSRDDVAQGLGKLFDQVEKFRAAGVGRFYVVISLSDIMENRPPYVVVPLEKGVDSKAVETALNETFGSGVPTGAVTEPVARTLSHAVVLAVPATFDRLKAATPSQRPELSSAFDAAGKAQIRLALIPQASARKQVEGVVGELPPELGGGPVQTVSRGLTWMSMAIAMPPSPSLKVVIQAAGADDAKKLDEIIKRAIAWAGERKNAPPEELAFIVMLSHLEPKLEGDRILIDLSAPGARQLAATLAGGFISARNNSSRIIVMNNLRQLNIGVILYANEHTGQLPKDLGPDVQKYLGADPQKLWTDPLRPNEKKPYVYLKLADKLAVVKDPQSAVMIYENHTTWDAGINVAFADGHCEWIADEKQFKSMLDQTKKNNPQAAEMPQ
jgi:prepilin-type processing-associated H-X9-DG protein